MKTINGRLMLVRREKRNYHPYILAKTHWWRKVRDPWSNWIPGVLNKTQLKLICEEGIITTVESTLDKILDHSSIDLSLADEGYRMINGSVKPSALKPYHWFLNKKRALAEPLPKQSDGSYLLKHQQT